MATRVLTSLTKPILFLFHHKSFHVVIYLDEMLVLTLTYASKSSNLLMLCCFILDYVIIFSKSELCLTQQFSFLSLLGYTGHVCLYCLMNLLRSSHWLMHGYRDNPLQPISCVLFRQGHLLCQWTCTTLQVVSCHFE